MENFPLGACRCRIWPNCWGIRPQKPRRRTTCRGSGPAKLPWIRASMRVSGRRGRVGVAILVVAHGLGRGRGISRVSMRDTMLTVILWARSYSVAPLFWLRSSSLGALTKLLDAAQNKSPMAFRQSKKTSGFPAPCAQRKSFLRQRFVHSVNRVWQSTSQPAVEWISLRISQAAADCFSCSVNASFQMKSNEANQFYCDNPNCPIKANLLKATVEVEEVKPRKTVRIP